MTGKILTLPLTIFVDVVREFEEASGSEEKWFWDTHAKLGNYLASPITQGATQKLYSFLRAWRSTRHRIAWRDFQALWTPELQAMAKACAAFSLDECHWDQNLSLHGHRCSLMQVVRMMYNRLTLVEGIGATNASKLMAIALPRLFVMWDSHNVRSLHGLRDTAQGFQGFLVATQDYGERLIREVMQQERCDRPQALSWLQKLPLKDEWNSVVRREKPLAKLIDEFYYRLPYSNVAKNVLKIS